MLQRPLFFQKLSGVFAAYKPIGITSAEMCNTIRERIHQDLSEDLLGDFKLKIGHGGVLDKHAHGVVAVGLENGCKILPLLLHGRKSYVCRGQFGIATDSYNKEGEITGSLPYEHIQLKDVETCLREHFYGDILQAPPAFSALKHHGERLSDLVKSGRMIPSHKLEPRPVTVHSIACTQFDLPDFTLEISCGSGFYVRSLIHDLGKALDTCAVVMDLQRTQHGPLTLDHTLHEDQWTVSTILSAIKNNRALLPTKSEKKKKMNKFPRGRA